MFYAYWLTGDGTKPLPMNQYPLNPHRIMWSLSKLCKEDTIHVDSSFVVEFTGELGAAADSLRYRQFYFRWARKEWLFGSPNFGLISCLTNCGDTPEWNGIDNIEENCWQTDIDNELSGVTANPVLAAYPDGPYRVDVFAYAYDTTVVDTTSVDIELHNFNPVVEEVILSCEGRTIWEASWTADGLTPVLYNPFDAGVLPDQQLDVTVVFSEPMDTTSVTVTAGMTSPYNDITASDTGLDWSWTNCPEEPEYKDTWHGVFDDLSSLPGGRITVSIQASDQDANGLMDPSIPCSDGTDYNDTHHSFSLMGVQPGWPVTLEDIVFSSPVLADVDEDGDLDVIIQSIDGHVHVIDDDGSFIGDWSSGGWVIDAVSSPAIVDIDGGSPEILSVYAYGCFAYDVFGNRIADWMMGDYPSHPGYYPSMSSPVVEDVDLDGYPEIFICRHLASSTILESTVYRFEHDAGRGTWTWARNLEINQGGSSVITTPAVCDVNNDGKLEVVVCSAEGYLPNNSTPTDQAYDSAVYILDSADGSDVEPPLYYDCWFHASPVIVDIDDDGVQEIILGTSGGSTGNKMLVISGNSNTEEHSWDLDDTVHGPVAIGDIDDNGYLDIVAGLKGGTINCWSGETYSDLTGFPVSIDDDPCSGPSVADIDGDSRLEIIVGTTSGNLYAINHDGSICSGFPINFGNGARGQVAIGNIDNDSGLEMVLADDEVPLIYCYDLGAGTYPALMPWRQFQHDSWHTGCYEADNTIPAPPTNLQVEQTDDVGMLLTWDLSVNDFHSSTPEEPTDVVSYQIYRGYPPHTLPSLVGRAHAGTDTYNDICDPWGPQVEYYLTASDGTNESGPSNIVRVRIEAVDILSTGCPVTEVFREGRVPSVGPADASSLDRSSGSAEGVGSAAPVHTAHESVPVSTGNAGCLTDGSLEEVYTPSPGAAAVVMDLGEECSVTAVIPQQQLTDYSDIAGTSSAVDTPEHSLRIEVAGTDRRFEPFNEGTRSSIEGVRYVRVHDATGLAEVSVYGTRRSSSVEPLSVAVARSSERDGWMFSIPLDAEGSSEEASIQIFDMSGRMVWSGSAESGDVLHWDGLSNGSPVPSGVYLLQCSIGSEVSTGSLVVRRDR
ncbi:MAG: T9SS type A sorting domain-containing protein [Candidatus Aegiribacteria sp.]